MPHSTPHGAASSRRAARQEWRLRGGAFPPRVSPLQTVPLQTAPVKLEITRDPQRAAVVCTMAYNAASLDSFICYYLFLGFSSLYLYLDDPLDASVEVARRYPAELVKVRVRDAALEREWQAVPSWKRLELYCAREVQARQMLNCEHAIARCRAAGEHWLLHVDSDELLWLPDAAQGVTAAASAASAAAGSDPNSAPGSALQRHLAQLDRLGAILFTYRNLEAVPEALECPDMYREVSLFKQHPSRLHEGSPKVDAAVRYWTSVDQAGGELFRFYSNGKSIVRVHDAIREAGSVHEWNLPNKQAAATAGFTNNSRLRHSQYVYHQLMRYEEMGGAVLLHFAICSFETFWKKKWGALGYASPNHRFRGGGGGLDQRANALAIGARREEAEALYRRSMMVSDEAEKARQLKCGVCVRVAVASVVDIARRSELPCAPSSASATAVAEHAARPPQQAGVIGTTTRLDSPSGAALNEAVSARRREALSAVAGDAVLTEYVEQAMEEAVRIAREMASEALAAALDDARSARRLVEQRGLPIGPSDAPPSSRYETLFQALLPRALRATLHLLPLPRLRFDLSGYWVHPMANTMITHGDAAALLRTGAVLLHSAFPSGLTLQAALEATRILQQDVLKDASTARAHEKYAWLLCDEAPPRAPTPPPAGAPPSAELFGAAHELQPPAAPALCGALRGLRGLAAALENLSELRLAVPRGGLLRQVGAGGVDARGPLNNGWPDSGCEVSITLFIGAEDALPHRVSIGAHGEQRELPAATGDVLLTLSRVATCSVQPIGGDAHGAVEPPRPLWLTVHAFSSSLRSAADGRMLGVSMEAWEEIREKQRRGEINGDELKGRL